MAAFFRTDELDALRTRAFAGASSEELSLEGLTQLKRWDLSVSPDGMAWQEIVSYRRPGSEGIVLVWIHGDGGNMFASHHQGPSEITREAYEALKAGLDGLRPEGVDTDPESVQGRGACDGAIRAMSVWKGSGA